MANKAGPARLSTSSGKAGPLFVLLYSVSFFEDQIFKYMFLIIKKVEKH